MRISRKVAKWLIVEKKRRCGVPWLRAEKDADKELKDLINELGREFQLYGTDRIIRANPLNSKKGYWAIRTFS